VGEDGKIVGEEGTDDADSGPADEDDGEESLAMPDDMNEAFPELEKAILRMTRMPSLGYRRGPDDSLYVYTACKTWARQEDTVAEFCTKMVQLQFVEMMKKVWKANFGEPLMTGAIDNQSQIELLQSNIWNLSDKSNDVCMKILEVGL
jgi:hypothetical protein